MIEEKKILILPLSGDFWVEADTDGDTYEFWLCRKGYGLKHFIFGEPATNYEDLKSALRDHREIFMNRGYMSVFLDDMLEGDEIDEHFNVL